jgi:hypothetical protein
MRFTDWLLWLRGFTVLRWELACAELPATGTLRLVNPPPAQVEAALRAVEKWRAEGWRVVREPVGVLPSCVGVTADGSTGFRWQV